MHERALVEDLVRHAGAICAQEGKRATRVKVEVGALTGVDPGHFADYFRLLAGEDSLLAGAELVVDKSDDLDEPAATSVVLDSISFAED